jgi:hypothetical protein
MSRLSAEREMTETGFSSKDDVSCTRVNRGLRLLKIATDVAIAVEVSCMGYCLPYVRIEPIGEMKMSVPLFLCSIC